MTGRHILPQFIVIGAVKAATTWLTGQLRQNPAIYLPEVEPHFFSSEYDRGFEWYSHFFRDAPPGHLPGDKSADYLAHPDAARRIADLLPDIPLIVQLRNPVDRAYSEYRMLCRQGVIGGPLEDYLIRSTARWPQFLDDGLYFHHLKRWLNHFPRERLKVILHEDVRERPAWVMEEICGHIGVPFHHVEEQRPEPTIDGPVHVASRQMRGLAAPFKRAVKPLRGNPIFEAMRNRWSPAAHCSPLSASLRAHMEDFYAPDVEGLARLIRRDLTPWLSVTRQTA